MTEEQRARATLADFLAREIGKGSARAWALQHGLGEREVRRALNRDTAVTLDKLEEFAAALHVEPWQLLFPGFNRGASEFPTMSREAIDLAVQLDSFDEAQRLQVYATLMRVIETVKMPPAPQAPPVEPPRPDPDTMRSRPKVL